MLQSPYVGKCNLLALHSIFFPEVCHLLSGGITYTGVGQEGAVEACDDVMSCLQLTMQSVCCSS